MPKVTDIPFRQLVADLGSHFPAGDFIRECDLPPLTEADLAVCIHYEDGLASDDIDPHHIADIYNSAVYLTKADKLEAIAQYVDACVIKSCRDYLVNEVNEWLGQQTFEGPLDPEMDLREPMFPLPAEVA